MKYNFLENINVHLATLIYPFDNTLLYLVSSRRFAYMEYIGLKVHVWCKIDIDMMGRYLRRHHHRRWCRSIIITLAMIENPYINRNAYFTLVDIAILLQFTVCCIMMRKRALTYVVYSYLWADIHFNFLRFSITNYDR